MSKVSFYKHQVWDPRCDGGFIAKYALSQFSWYLRIQSEASTLGGKGPRPPPPPDPLLLISIKVVSGCMNVKMNLLNFCHVRLSPAVQRELFYSFSEIIRCPYCGHPTEKVPAGGEGWQKWVFLPDLNQVDV